MKKTLPLLAVLLSMPAFSQENPITGRLPDPVNVRIDALRASDQPSGSQELTIGFCNDQLSKTSCYSPNRSLNLSGVKVSSGIEMTPAVKGEWRWNYDYRLSFTPEKSWPAGQSYHVTLAPSIFPGGVSMTNGEFDFSTAPLSATFSQMEYLQDPGDPKKKGVNATVSFNYPVVKESFEKHLSVHMEDNAGPNKTVVAKDALPYEIEYNEERTQATFSVAIETLPEKDRFLRFDVASGVETSAGGKALTPELAKKATGRVLIPSLYSYLKIDSVEAVIVKNAKFEPEQVMTITSNAPIAGDELRAHLSVKLLPKNKPGSSALQSPKKNYMWQSDSEITPDIAKQMGIVNYTILPTAEEYSTVHSLRFSAPRNRSLVVTVAKGTHALGGYILSKDYVEIARAPSFPKEIKIMQDGAVLSLQGDKKLSIYSLGVDKLEYTVGRVIPGNINHFVSQSNGSFEAPSMNWNFDSENFTEVFHSEQQLTGKSDTVPQYSAFDFSDYVKSRPVNRGLFFFNVKATGKDKKGNVKTLAEDKRFVLITDLGFIIKENAGGTRDLFVMSIDEGEPASRATVEVLGKNGVPVFSKSTDGEGHVLLPNLSGFEHEKQPVAYVVQDGRDLSFMPFGRYDRDVNYSKFATSGIESVEGGLRAFLFSDRGIYRPGEEVHLGMVVKQQNWAQDLTGLPLSLEITNPRGQVIQNKAVKLNAEGFVDHAFSTKDVSPTGVYNVRLSIAKGKDATQIGQTSVRVEEFLPDTMKMTSSFSKDAAKGWVAPKDLTASVKLVNLYGTPATQHRVTANINLAPGEFTFPDFKGYSFFNAKSTDKSIDEPLDDAQTDDNGDASFDLKLGQYGDSTYRLTFYAEGFEEGSGRSVKTARSILVSPLSYVVGSKADGPLSYIDANTDRRVQFLSLDPGLKSVPSGDLTLTTASVTYINSLVKKDGGYAYQSVPKETIVKTEKIAIPAQGLDRSLTTDKPGDYVLILTDAKGLVRHRLSYSVAGSATAIGASKKDAIVEIKLDKPSYTPGDTMSLSLNSPYTGAGLITLETDKVLSHKWFETKDAQSVQTIEIPEGFEGKGFVNVQFVRGVDSKEIYMSPLSIGVEPFFVSMEQSDAKPVLTVPEKIRPGDTLKVSYHTKRPAKIMIWGVDEGILQYGHYETPNPLDYLAGKRALQVKTSQIFDLLMPEYSVMQSLSAAGGDASLGDGKNLNPFKRKSLAPVVFWSGVIKADATDKEYSYKVPDYFNGSIRVMAAAVSVGSIGSTEARTTVQGELIVSPNAPVFVAPGDEFDVTTSVANHIDGSGKDAKIDVSITPSEQLELIGEKTQKVTVPEGEEATVKIRVRAKDSPGGASLVFTASQGTKQAHYEATLSVRPAVPSMTSLQAGYVGGNEKIVPLSRALYPQFASAEASVSGLPLSLLPGLKKYLEDYPYGCAEQTMSKTIPALVLFDEPDFAASVKDARSQVETAISRLREMQGSSGALSMWQGGEDDPFVSVYGLHYLILAKEKHFGVPNDMLNPLTAYVRQYANQSVTSLADARLHTYAIYLLTRGGEVTTNYLPYVLQYLEANEKGKWKSDLTAVYIAATYKLLQMGPEATALIKEFQVSDAVMWKENTDGWFFDDGNDGFYDSLSRYGQYLYILSEHFPEMAKNVDRNVVFRIANFIGENRYNTLNSSYTIMGLDAYAKAAALNSAASLSISARHGEEAFKPLALTGDKVKRGDFPVEASELKFTGGKDAALFYALTTGGFDKILPKTEEHHGLEVTRRYTDEKGGDVSSVKLGDKITVTLTLRSHDYGYLKNVAMVDLLPGGFELIPESLPKTALQESEAADDESESDTPPAPAKTANAWSIDSLDAREDRVIAYGTVNSTPETFTYKIKAINSGRFTSPPSFGESMYERSVTSHGVAGSLSVE